MKKLLITLVLFLLTSTDCFGGHSIVPPEYVMKLAREKSYSDFPRTEDILAITMVESGFNPNAKNGISNGLMQVNNGSMNPKRNMEAGITLLRKLYVILNSKKAAIMSYNIGIGNYLRSKFMISGDSYYNKYLSHRRYYEHTAWVYNSGIAIRDASTGGLVLWKNVGEENYRTGTYICSMGSSNKIPGKGTHPQRNMHCISRRFSS